MFLQSLHSGATIFFSLFLQANLSNRSSLLHLLHILVFIIYIMCLPYIKFSTELLLWQYTVTFDKSILVRKPGLEPGTAAWRATILPLNYFRMVIMPRVELGSWRCQRHMLPGTLHDHGPRCWNRTDIRRVTASCPRPLDETGIYIYIIKKYLSLTFPRYFPHIFYSFNFSCPMPSIAYNTGKF